MYNFIDINFQNAVDEIDWTNVLQCEDIEHAANEFHRLLSLTVDQHAPFINLKLRVNAPKWINGDFLAHVNEREFLSKKHKKCPCQYHLTLKLESKIRTRQLKISLQESYFEESLNSATTVKQKWQKIKEFWPHLKKSGKIFNINGESDETVMANILNEFFVNVGQNLAESIPENNINPVDTPHLPPVFELIELDLLGVATLIRDLKPSSSCGVDGLTARIIKAAGPSIFPVLLHLINLSIKKNIFPGD